MGVLNFPGTFHQRSSAVGDVFPFGANVAEVYLEPDVEVEVQNVSTRNKRKRTKSGCKSQYNFHDYGIDERRRGSKHQRRKQNFHELQEIAGDEASEESCFIENQMTVFTELFLDECKMKVWERFIALSEDKQCQYIEEFESRKVAPKNSNNDTCHEDSDETDDVHYLLIDHKIRDMLRSKQLSNNVNGLLKYYEDDVLSCFNDVSPPAVLILDIEDAYDRMLVYAVCQYMKLSSSTIKLKTSTIIEIDLDEETPMHYGKTLTEYLQTNAACLN